MSSASGPTTNVNNLLMQMREKILELEKRINDQPNDEQLDETNKQVEEQRRLLEDCRDTVEQTMVQIEGYKDDINALKVRTGDKRSTVKIHEPDTYKGDRAKLEHFLGECDIYLATKPGVTDTEKVIFAGSYMREAAATWFKPYLEDWTNTGGRPILYADVLNSYARFKQVLRQFFGDTDRKRTLQRKL